MSKKPKRTGRFAPPDDTGYEAIEIIDVSGWEVRDEPIVKRLQERLRSQHDPAAPAAAEKAKASKRNG